MRTPASQTSIRRDRVGGTVHFTAPAPHEEIIAWGLPAGRLGLVAAGAVAAATCLNLPEPDWLRGLEATSTMAGAAALAWARLGGLPAWHWALLLLRMVWRNRAGILHRRTGWAPVELAGPDPTR